MTKAEAKLGEVSRSGRKIKKTKYVFLYPRIDCR